MRWCRNPYAPLDQGLVNAGHPEARQKRPSIASTSAHAADTRGWVDRRSRQGYFLVGRSPLNAGFARPLAARPRSPTLPSGATSGPHCGMPNSPPKLAWFLHTRTPPGGLFSGGSRGFGSMALTGPSLGLPANLLRWRGDRSATHPGASRRMWIRRSARITGARLPAVPGRLLQMLSSIRFDP